MLAILAPIFVFGLVIFVHELGHFLAAKAMGVYAPRFSIGFGPALFRKRRGETEYVLAMLPLGGYVRMASRLDEETAFLEGGSEEKAAEKAAVEQKWEDPEAMVPFGPKPVPPDRWFESKSLPARLLIMVAGVTMNVLLSLVVYIGLVYHTGRQIVPTTVVGGVTHTDSVPELKGLAVGDTIRAVNGVPVKQWDEVRTGILGSTGSVALATQRDTVRIPLTTGRSPELIANSVEFWIPPVLNTIVPGERGDSAGFRSGDSVIAISGTPVRTWSDLIRQIGSSPGKEIEIVVARPGETATRSIRVTPKAVREPDLATGKPASVGKIGAARRDVTTTEPIGIGDAMVEGSKITWRAGGLIIGFLHSLFVGEVSVRELGGPIAITKASVVAARSGVEHLFDLIALLSINIAVLNLLPIPILDGGQIVINIIESAKGSPFSLRTREYILRFGLVAIGLLFVIVMYNDTRGGFEKLFGWVVGLFG
jgi:regulator of sigma E protease